jgi:hypothetical protein
LKKYGILPRVAILFLSFNASFCFSQVNVPRAWAEWEETDGIIIHQPNFYLQENPTPVEWLVAEEWDSLYVDLIRGLKEEGVNTYYILDTNDRPEYHSGILDTMHLKYDIDINDLLFHVVIGCKENYSDLTKWTRDHGPMNVYLIGADSLHFFLFRDDAKGAGGIMRDYLGIPDTVFYNASSGGTSSDGGNYLVDGCSMGIVNGGAGALLPEIKEYYGLDTVYALPDYLEHIDYYLKLLNEETLIISSQERENYIYGTETYTFEEDSAILSGMVSFFQEQVISQYGRPMKVFQVPNPPSMRDDSLQLWWYTQYASYTNSLIVNGSVFVPQFNIPGIDSTAREIYSEAMPGYKIVPVFCRRGATAGGAVHCLTNSVAATEPVYIKHSPYSDTAEQAPGYEIIAAIMTRSGVKSAIVHWSATPGGPFQQVTMQNISGDSYSGSIQPQAGTPDIYYYITAESNSGKTGTKPLVAPGYTIRGGAPGWISHVRKAQGIIKIYPNPASVMIRIEMPEEISLINESFSLNIYDQLGRRVFSRLISPVGSSFDLNVSSLGPGQYFLVLMGENGEFYYDKLLIAGN